MSQPYRDTNPFLSSPVSRPSLGQSPSIPFSSTPQPVLSQKLIPRDFLGLRSKPSTDTVSSVGTGELKNAASKESLQHFRDIQSNQGNGVPREARLLTSDGKATPDRDPFTGHELSIERTRSPESLESPPPAFQPSSTNSNGSVSAHTDLPVRTIMPRTSSIDSAISSVSTTSLNRVAGDGREPSPTTVRNLIATAGGAETLIMHLLKDKNTVASQNAQLWKLVEKQRALLLGLNKDLERITKERDKYKKRCKEIQDHANNQDIPHGHPTPQPAQKHSGSGQHSTGPPSMVQLQPKPSAVNMSASNPATTATTGPTKSPQVIRDKENLPKSDEAGSEPPQVYIEKVESPGLPVEGPKLDTLMAAPPVFNIIEASPLVERPGKTVPSNRKAPPKPLNLAQRNGESTPTEQDTGRSEASIHEEESGRGRRKTREEDDREREKSAIKAEIEARSRSKKEKAANVLATEHQVPAAAFISPPLPTPGLPLSPRPQHAQTFVAPQNNLTVGSISQPASLGERLLAAPLKSPGLPHSPRPSNRIENPVIGNSLPLSPRANMGNFPLSPRAPKHALPIPTNPGAPADAATLQKRNDTQTILPQSASITPVDRLQVHQPVGSEPPPVYRGLAAPAYPNLLLPPNALPSIQVQVHSSRLRPSRHSVLGLKNQEDSTIFSLSVISRSSNSELWRVEKAPAALPQLEQQLRPRCVDLPKMPDRKLFIGQSPALLDERRLAIDNYFDELLDIHVDEQAAVTICKFLSTDVIDPEQQMKTVSSADASPRVASPTGTVTKTGYLTKKGKNFGGWKSRFFSLDAMELRYYESPGGQHLGTIRLSNALIGKQRETEPTDEPDGQFRHAFLIQEPKRKDSTTYIRHVLCAESDAERDEWVKVLLHYVEGSTNSGHATKGSTNSIPGQVATDLESQNSSVRVGSSMKEIMHHTKETHNNSPTPTSISSIDSSILDQAMAAKPSTISGPMNGGVITDTSTWGNKPIVNASAKELKDKSYKMSNIFSFKKPDPSLQQEPKPAKPRILRHNGYVRPVFGLPLAEALEFCAPFNVEVDLPAVVYRCIEYLRYRNAANEEGLFRLSGSNVVVRSLKERFNTEGDVDLVNEEEYHDVHAVASLFKTYLRELPSTLLTRDLHIEFIQVLELESSAEKVAAFNVLVHRLPSANYSLLKEMSSYLLEVTRNADKNKMSVRNVGIVFSPTLNIPTPVFTLFLTEFAAIFEAQPSQISQVKSTEISVPPTLTPDDVRSPRHQMFSDLPTPAPQQTTFPGLPGPIPHRGTMTGTGELGFMPIHPSYESGNYVSIPRNVPAQAAAAQTIDTGGYSSLNGLLAPAASASEKAKRRESAILFANPAS